MTLRLNSSGGGYVEADAPNIAGNYALTLPTSAGSANQFLKNSGTAGTLEYSSMVEDSSGNVGVGTTSPADTNSFGGTLDLSGSQGGALYVRNQTSASKYGAFGFYDTDIYVTTYATGNIRFNTGSSGTERLRIDSSGNVGIGTTPSFLLDLFGTTPAVRIKANGVSNGVKLEQSSATGNVELNVIDTYPLIFKSANTERMRITNSGTIKAPGVYSLTTASAANVFVASDGDLARSTSSSKYKTDVETIQDSYSDALLACRPVWYRSTCEEDNPDHSWWGFIAEEVAEIDPRLVHWKTVEVTYDENGSAVESPCDPEPEGVAYDRFVPHLLNLIKRQKEQIETQGAAIAALEARLTALEGGAS